jgi:hypothetical protein
MRCACCPEHHEPFHLVRDWGDGQALWMCVACYDISEYRGLHLDDAPTWPVVSDITPVSQMALGLEVEHTA